MNKKMIFILPVLVLFLTALLALRPISNVTLEESEMIIGTVNSIISNEKTGDVSFELLGDETNYYINRGIEKGLIVNNLKKDLKNQKVDIYYAKHWTPLDPMGANKHISRVVKDGNVLYDEIKE